LVDVCKPSKNTGVVRHREHFVLTHEVSDIVEGLIKVDIENGKRWKIVTSCFLNGNRQSLEINRIQIFETIGIAIYLD
jgi:hypothetical protein